MLKMLGMMMVRSSGLLLRGTKLNETSLLKTLWVAPKFPLAVKKRNCKLSVRIPSQLLPVLSGQKVGLSSLYIALKAMLKLMN